MATAKATNYFLKYQKSVFITITYLKLKYQVKPFKKPNPRAPGFYETAFEYEL